MTGFHRESGGDRCCADAAWFCNWRDEMNVALPINPHAPACDFDDCKCPDGFTKDLVWDKCNPNPPSSSPSPTPAKTNGDPHFQTWKGTDFEFQGECDLVIVKAPLIDLDIHVRTTIRYDYSFISQAAVRIGEDVFEVASYGEYQLNDVNTARLPAQMGDHKVIMKSVSNKKKVFYIHMDRIVDIEIAAFKDYISVSILNGTMAMFHNVSGMLGHFETGDVTTRDGTTIMDFREPNLIGQEWQVQPEVDGQLFSEARAPQYPSKCELPAATAVHARNRKLGEAAVSREDAEAACAGVGEDRANCISDVLKTGDIEFAQAY